MATPSLLLQTLLPLESVQLGRLVVNATHPHQEFYDPLGNLLDFTLTKPQQDIQAILSLSQNANLRSRLTALFSSLHQRQKADTITLKVSQATTYQLKNSNTWLHAACGQQETRDWFEKTLQYSEDMYLVVGYYSFTDALVTQAATSSTATSGGFQLSGALIGGTLPVPVGNALNVRVNSVREVNNRSECGLVGSGEQIYAVQYRKLKFGWFSSRKIEKSSLERNNRWKIFMPEVRGEVFDEEEEEEEEDVLEVELTDELDPEMYVDGAEELMF